MNTITPKTNRRKTATLALLAAVFGGGAAMSQPAMAQEVVVAPGYVARDINGLEQLAGPVALYPDAVLADVLVASTHPQDVVSAANYLSAGYNPTAIDAQGWDASVASIARFPTILNYMVANPAWMNDLGTAYVNQPNDVMAAVQALRSEAQAAGNLASNNVQQVVLDGGIIEIIPADPQFIVLPVYDPACAYTLRPGPVAYVTFGPRVEVGAWLGFDLDWHDRVVYAGDWGRDRPWWHRDERTVYANARPGNFHATTVVHQTVVRNNVTNITNVRNVTNTTVFRDDHRPAPAREPARPQGLLERGRNTPEYRPRPAERTVSRSTVETRTATDGRDSRGRTDRDR